MHDWAHPLALVVAPYEPEIVDPPEPEAEAEVSVDEKLKYLQAKFDAQEARFDEFEKVVTAKLEGLERLLSKSVE